MCNVAYLKNVIINSPKKIIIRGNNVLALQKVSNSDDRVDNHQMQRCCYQGGCSKRTDLEINQFGKMYLNVVKKLIEVGGYHSSP
jgi:hypothetical protein